MQRLTSRNMTGRPPRPVTRTLSVCVVDPKSDDYQGWQATAEAHGLRFQIVATAEEALRLARTSTVDLWVINTELPGLTGYELCSMIKNQTVHTAVNLLADEYSPKVEQAAWQAGATLFDIKPIHTAAVRQWFAHRFNISCESLA